MSPSENSGEPAYAAEVRRIDAEAAEWWTRRDAGLDNDEAAAFAHWLAADPRHAARFEHYLSVWGRFGGMTENDLDTENQPESRPLIERQNRGFWSRRWAGVAAAGLALAGVGIGSLNYFTDRTQPTAQLLAAPSYSNHILEDGTILELNTGSEVRVAFDATERRLELVRGEVHVDVTRDPDRPLVVRAGGAAVRAIGTAFNVRMVGDAVEVVVTEGSVSLVPDTSFEKQVAPRTMDVGQRSVLRRGTASEDLKVDDLSLEQMREALAWKPLLLEFSGAPLGDVVKAFNRRNRVQMIISDPSLENLSLSIAFHSDDVETFTRMLTLTFGIQTERRGEAEILLRAGR